MQVNHVQKRKRMQFRDKINRLQKRIKASLEITLLTEVGNLLIRQRFHLAIIRYQGLMKKIIENQRKKISDFFEN